MPKAEFLALDPETRNRLVGVTVEPEIRSVNNQLVDVTDPSNPTVIFGEAARPTPKLLEITLDGVPATVDVNTKDGQALMDRANAANEQAAKAGQPKRATFYSVTSPPSPRGFLIDGTIRMSYDNGRTYIANGQSQSVPEDAFEVSNTTSYDVYKSENAKAKAASQLQELSLKILGSSALSVSPRLAVFDLARVERLFPDPDAFFRNPQSEANKLVVLKRVALNQKRRILEEQQAGIGDTGLKAQLNQKLYEIDRLLDMLGSVDIAGGSGVDPAQLDALRQSITRTN